MNMAAMIYLLAAILYVNATANDSNRIVIEGDSLSHPIIMLVDIPSSGLLKKQNGKAFVLNDATGKYVEIDQFITIGFGSVIQLDRDSSVNINFNDGSYLTLGPVLETKWYKFKVAESHD